MAILIGMMKKIIIKDVFEQSAMGFSYSDMKVHSTFYEK